MRWRISVWVVLVFAAACSDSGNGATSTVSGDDASTSDGATGDSSVGDSSSADGAGDASSQDGSSACGDPESTESAMVRLVLDSLGMPTDAPRAARARDPTELLGEHVDA